MKKMKKILGISSIAFLMLYNINTIFSTISSEKTNLASLIKLHSANAETTSGIYEKSIEIDDFSIEITYDESTNEICESYVISTGTSCRGFGQLSCDSTVNNEEIGKMCYQA